MIIFDNLFKQLQQSNTQQARGMPPILASEICATIDKPSLTELSTQVFRDNSGGVRTLATGSTVMHMLAFLGEAMSSPYY